MSVIISNSYLWRDYITLMSLLGRNRSEPSLRTPAASQRGQQRDDPHQHWRIPPWEGRVWLSHRCTDAVGRKQGSYAEVEREKMRERPGMLEKYPSKLKEPQHRGEHCWPPLAGRHSFQLCSYQHEPLLSKEPTKREQPRWQNHHHEARYSLVHHHGHFDPRAGIFRSLVYAKQHLQHIRMKL